MHNQHIAPTATADPLYTGQCLCKDKQPQSLKLGISFFTGSYYGKGSAQARILAWFVAMFYRASDYFLAHH